MDDNERLDDKEERYAELRSLCGNSALGAVTVTLRLPGNLTDYPWWPFLLDEGIACAQSSLAGAGFSLGETVFRYGPSGAAWLATLGYSRPSTPTAPKIAMTSTPAVVSESDKRLTGRAKTALIQLEGASPLGPLLDLDVYSRSAEPVSRTALGFPPRKCLVCEKPAHLCRLKRSHPADLLKKAAVAIWKNYETRRKTEAETAGPDYPELADRVSRVALFSTVLEAACWPSPGLVSPYSKGAHEDMNYLLYLKSSSVLASAFRRLTVTGIEHRSSHPRLLFRQLRYMGSLAEKDMLCATGGVNTHKGLLFSLGLACGAAGFLAIKSPAPTPRIEAQAISLLVSQMTKGLVNDELSDPNPQSVSQRSRRLFSEWKLTGIRGEAEKGFPTVLHTGLPALKKALDAGFSLSDAMVHALIALISAVEDTALAGRHSPETLVQYVQPVARDALEAGGVLTIEGRKAILSMERDFSAKRLNPGGSADLLALTLALHQWEHGEFEGAALLRPGLFSQTTV